MHWITPTGPKEFRSWEGTPSTKSVFTHEQLVIMQQERPKWRFFDTIEVTLFGATRDGQPNVGDPHGKAVCPVLAKRKDRTAAKIINAVRADPLAEDAGFDRIWRWRTNLPGRHGAACRLIARGTMNSAIIEFEDGARFCVSRNAFMKRKPRI